MLPILSSAAMHRLCCCLRCILAPSHQAGRRDPWSLHTPLGTYSLGAPQMFSLFLRGFVPCPCGLVLALDAEDLGWGWDMSIKQKAACQFFTRPDFALGLVLAWWRDVSAPWQGLLVEADWFDPQTVCVTAHIEPCKANKWQPDLPRFVCLATEKYLPDGCIAFFQPQMAIEMGEWLYNCAVTMFVRNTFCCRTYKLLCCPLSWQYWSTKSWSPWWNLRSSRTCFHAVIQSLTHYKTLFQRRKKKGLYKETKG